MAGIRRRRVDHNEGLAGLDRQPGGQPNPDNAEGRGSPVVAARIDCLIAVRVTQVQVVANQAQIPGAQILVLSVLDNLAGAVLKEIYTRFQHLI